MNRERDTRSDNLLISLPVRACVLPRGRVGGQLLMVVRVVKAVFVFGVFMRRRVPVNKFRSAKQFRRSVSKTKMANVKAVQRGGIRL